MAEKILSTWAEQAENKEIHINFQQNNIQNVNIK